jgi:hypothetical protein
MLLTACSKDNPSLITPVSYNCPTIVLPKLPHLPVRDIKSSSSDQDVIKAYVASLKLMISWHKIVKRQVDGSN